MNLNPKIYLASKSPRRKEILENAGFQIVLIEIDVEESFPETMDVHEVAEYISRMKIKEVTEFPGDGITLTADTVVILDNKILGKPESRKHAVDMLRQLSGKEHEVVTGVSLRSANKQVDFSTLSKVHIDPLSDEEIYYYLDHFKPYDKAGSYGIQDWLGMCKVNELKGSFYNVMGLPIYELNRQIQENF